MQSLVFFVVIIVSLLSGGVTQAVTPTSTRTPTITRTPTATPTATPVVDCGFKLTVTNNNANNGATLTLDPGAPIFHKTCARNGITIRNRGGAFDSSFVLDCANSGTITGSGVGVGISINGPSISVYNCTVKGFQNGFVANGKGADIEANTALSSVGKRGVGGNGFVIKNRATGNMNSDYYLDTYVLGNTAENNAGFGFKITGNGVTSDNGSLGYTTNVFANLASSNGLGGFSVSGKTDMVGSLDNGTQANQAISNKGPGISVVNNSCCFPNSLSYAQVISNTGAGIVYVGRDDGTNCYGATGGPPCYASGLDLFPGDIQSLGNTGTCPKGFISVAPGNPPTTGPPDGQICVKTGKCSNAVLNNCAF